MILRKLKPIWNIVTRTILKELLQPLKKADDATLIDTTEYDFDGAVKLVKDLILEKTEG